MKKIQISKTIQTMSTPEISLVTGIRHDNVMRKANQLFERRIIASPQIEEMVNIGSGAKRARKIYQLTKVESLNLVANLSPEFTAAIIDRWQELEARKDDMQTAMQSATRMTISYAMNEQYVPFGRFSAQSLCFIEIIIPFTKAGGKLTKEMHPEISFGLCYSKHFERSFGFKARTLGEHEHHFDDGRFPVQVISYPDKYKPHAFDYMRNDWLQGQFPEYIRKRDQSLLPSINESIQYMRPDENNHRPALPYYQDSFI